MPVLAPAITGLSATELASLIRQKQLSPVEDEISSNTREFLAMAADRPPLTGDCLMNTLLERDQVRRQVLSQMEEFPVLLSPVCSIPAFRHEDAGWGPQHPANYLRTMFAPFALLSVKFFFPCEEY